jgi:hypothetical protein
LQLHGQVIGEPGAHSHRREIDEHEIVSCS